MSTCENCGSSIESEDDGAIWYHTGTVSAYCDGDDERARYWSELADGVAVPANN